MVGNTVIKELLRIYFFVVFVLSWFDNLFIFLDNSGLRPWRKRALQIITTGKNKTDCSTWIRQDRKLGRRSTIVTGITDGRLDKKVLCIVALINVYAIFRYIHYLNIHFLGYRGTSNCLIYPMGYEFCLLFIRYLEEGQCRGDSPPQPGKQSFKIIDRFQSWLK